MRKGRSSSTAPQHRDGARGPHAGPVRNICVYCGSGLGFNAAYAEAARAVGTALGRSGIGLVYGGGSFGLMGEVARATLAAGGHVTGIIPEFLSELELTFREAQEVHVVRTMHERKQLMFERSDAFVALPGGIGTLEEFVEQMTWAQVGRHRKPLALLNTANYWSPFIGLLQHMRQEGFVRPQLEVDLLVVDRPEDVVPALHTHAAKLAQLPPVDLSIVRQM
jgi:uncharacterized protein (TIGR00730 family)